MEITEARHPPAHLLYFCRLKCCGDHCRRNLRKKVAELAAQDIDVAISEGPGFFFPDLRGISTMPYSHMYRGFINLVTTPMIPVSVFKLPMLLRGVMKRFDANALWPHELFSYLYH